MITNHKEKGLFPLALVLLIGVGSFFFISYGFANWVTSLRSNVGSIFFEWERFIPLWPWTIVPYWSLDLLYGLAFFLCATRRELYTLARRLLTIQVICVSCFLLFPLRFAFDRPPLEGFFGLLFDILMGFDKPFNQAPSLHISLTVIMWSFYARHTPKSWHYAICGWFVLICASVLTTWQHHFIDIPTGVLAGCFSIWLWPFKQTSPLCIKQPPRQWKWALGYLIAAFVIAFMALIMKGWWLWLLWLATSLLLVAANYSFIGAKGFQKQSDGLFPIATLFLYLPYTAIMWINSRFWTRKNNHADLILENVYLGRIPNQAIVRHYGFKAIVDFCAELPIKAQEAFNYHSIPVLDMTAPSMAVCEQAAKLIEQCNQQGAVLVCCALGYSRSATAIVAWLLWSKRVETVEAAIALVKQAKPDIVINLKQQKVLHEWLASSSLER